MGHLYDVLLTFHWITLCVCDSVLSCIHVLYNPPTKKDTHVHVSPKGNIASKLAALCYGNRLIKHVISDIHLYQCCC